MGLQGSSVGLQPWRPGFDPLAAYCLADSSNEGAACTCLGAHRRCTFSDTHENTGLALMCVHVSMHAGVHVCVCLCV